MPSQVRTRVMLFRKSPESVHLAGISQPAAASGLPRERTTTTASVAALRFVSMRNISFLLPGIARRRHDADRPRDSPQALLVCPEVVSIGAFFERHAAGSSEALGEDDLVCAQRLLRCRFHSGSAKLQLFNF